MIHNLFSDRQSSRQPHDSWGRSVSASTHRSAPRHDAALHGEADRSLFHNCVTQVQKNLKQAVTSPSLLHTLASYYTRREPYVDQRPFCVSLSFSTFLFHMQMSRISLADTDLYAQLVANVLSQITGEDRASHPFVRMVLHDRIFGIPSPTCAGAAHCVVLAPPQQYRAFSRMVTSLIGLNVVPPDILFEFHQRLYHYCEANSPLVSNRALTLLIRTVKNVELSEQAEALQLVLLAKPGKMNVDFILACFERLKRIAIDPSTGPRFVGALCIHCSEIFLRFRSPIRREYVTGYLYPSLRRSDMEHFLEVREAREHLLRQLLLQCTPGLSPSNPYYLCIAAVVQRHLDDECTGAIEIIQLLRTQMPHAAYFVAALAVDPQMSVSVFCKIIITLSRGVGYAMLGGGGVNHDEVAALVGDNATCVYNIIFTLREVVRSCSLSSSSSSMQGADMLKSLRLALPLTGIERLGRVAAEAFDESRHDVALDPELLCAEMAMILHHKHLEEAIESSFHFFRYATRQCSSCGLQNSSSFLCPVTHSLHMAGQMSATRLLAALAECAGAPALHHCLIQYIQNPESQMDNALHALLYYIISHAGSNTKCIFDALEPYIRGTLVCLSSMDRAGMATPNLGYSPSVGVMTSEQRANVLMLHVRLVCLFPERISTDYYDSLLTVLSDLSLSNNHDMLSLWYMGNILVRQSGHHAELLPTDPLENNYCIDYPACAPNSQESALNAQRVLKLLDKAHNFSAESRKLVGCSVCRLIQDFNLQAPNIVGNLLSSYGFVSLSLDSLSHFALPIGEHSTFWSFFLQQMRSSAPARTSFMAALARSVGRRFRIEKPSAAVSIRGIESTGHLFTVWMFEAMKRNPSLSRVTLFMVSNWMKQRGHYPGKFACLVYTCTQLIEVIASRFEDSSAVEREAETMADQRVFNGAILRAATNLEKSLPRLKMLIRAISQEGLNPVFCRLLQRIEWKSSVTAANVTGKILDLEVPTDEDADDHQFEMSSSAPVEDGVNNVRIRNASFRREDSVVKRLEEVRVDDEESIENEAVPLSVHGLENHEDDDFFDSFPDDEKEGTGTELDVRSSLNASIGSQDCTQIYDPKKEGRGTLPFSSSPLSPPEELQTTLDRADLPSLEVRSTDVKGAPARFEASAGTSLIQLHEPLPPLPGTPMSTGLADVLNAIERRLPHVVGAASSDVALGWYEPSMEEWNTDSDVLSPGQQQKEARVIPGEGVPIPSAMTLEYLRHHQGMNSLREELLQLSLGLSPRQREGAPLQDQVVSHYIPTAVMPPATFPFQANDYHQPHSTTTSSRGSERHPFPDERGVPVAASSWAPPSLVPPSSLTGGAAERMKEEAIVDGESAIPPVSMDPHSVSSLSGGDQDHRKRSRLGYPAQVRDLPDQLCSAPKGMLYLLQQEHKGDAHPALVLDELRSAVGCSNPSSGSMRSAGPAGGILSEPDKDLHPDPLSRSNGEHNLQKTPYGQIRIPQCLIEQNNDTAIQEVRQAMGSRSVNSENEDTRKEGQRHRSKGGSTVERSTSLALWAEMSAVSMPNYVTDVQYSMELF